MNSMKIKVIHRIPRMSVFTRTRLRQNLTQQFRQQKHPIIVYNQPIDQARPHKAESFDIKGLLCPLNYI